MEYKIKGMYVIVITFITSCQFAHSGGADRDWQSETTFLRFIYLFLKAFYIAEAKTENPAWALGQQWGSVNSMEG